MDENVFREKLAKRQLGGMWLLYGPERYVIHAYLMSLMKLPGEAMREMNTARLEAPDEAQIRSAADALPFFDDLRVVVCEKTDPEVIQAVAAQPGRIPDTTVLVFIHYGKLRADSVLVKQFKKEDRDVLCDVRTEDQARRFIDNMARRSGVPFKNDAVLTLLERRGTDLAQLESDIGMLSCVHEDGAPVTAQDVKRYIPERTENKSWDLLGKFLKGDFGGGLRMYQKMLADDPKCDFMILGYMEKRVAQLTETQEMLKARRSEREIGEVTGIKGWALTKLLEEARGSDPATLRRALEALAETDYYIKSGIRPARDALFTAFAESFMETGKKKPAEKRK